MNYYINYYAKLNIKQIFIHDKDHIYYVYDLRIDGSYNHTSWNIISNGQFNYNYSFALPKHMEGRELTDEEVDSLIPVELEL